MYYPRLHHYPSKKQRHGSIILSILGSAILTVLFFWALWAGMNKTEKMECIKWKEWAKDYPLYQSADWQLEQCEHHGLPLPK